MFDTIIAYSVRNKIIVFLGVIALIIWGTYSATELSIDAVPDITNNQVQIVTTSPSLAAQEVEKFITYPIELKMANLPSTQEIRSISRYGLSIVTVIFEEDYPLLNARQLVSEYLQTLGSEIPESMGTPELMPISTGLGEVYQYTLEVAPEFKEKYSAMELRTIQDWLVKRQLNGINGVVEISSFGGYLKQYEVAVDPKKLQSVNLTISEVFEAISANNENTGGSYIEKGPRANYVRSEGLIQSLEQVKQIGLKSVNGIPLTIGDIAEVKEGFAPRFGALTKNGEGETVGGILLMLKGENAFKVVENIEQRVNTIQSSLPEGITIQPYLNRSDLVSRVIRTVEKNLLEGGLIVVFILVLLLGNARAGIVVASVIPLSLLFAFSLMNLFGISANLMSLGAVDFGIVVDGSVIIVEAIIHRFQEKFRGKTLSRETFENELIDAAQKIRNSAAFGEIIILIVYLPILALAGIEGKTFKPMAQTIAFAILGAFILSMTYVPMMSSLLLKKTIASKTTYSDRFIEWLQRGYDPILHRLLRFKKSVIGVAVIVFVGSIFVFNQLGAVFIPTLGEGDLALQLSIPPGGSLNKSIETTTRLEKILIEEFPEVKQVVSKIGTAEVPTDPMAIENSDVMIILKPKSEWTSATNREELVEKMKASLQVILGASFEFTQPIQLRFNELLTGSKADVAVKIYGENLSTLAQLSEKAERIIATIPGASDVKAEQLEGLPQLMIRYHRKKLAQHQLTVQDVNRVIETSFAGAKASTIYEGEKRFDFVVRLNSESRNSIAAFNTLYIKNREGVSIPVSQLADIGFEEGPMQISRENTKRRVIIGVNVRNRDVKSLVEEIDLTLKNQLNLPAGYTLSYGGDFENLQSATNRLLIAVPAALLLILLLLFFAFKSVTQSIMIFTAIPLAAIGGILSLYLRDMPFSISAGIGFIALFGVAVLNGIVLIAEFNQLKAAHPNWPIIERIVVGSKNRLRPVLMTASVAAFGFLPMAISTSDGAEVQRPLATVVIGGLITSTLLTLFVLPAIYAWVEKGLTSTKRNVATVVTLLFLGGNSLNAQSIPVSLDSALNLLHEKNISIQQADLAVQQSKWQEKGSWQLGETRFQFQRGQLNTAAIDNYWSVEQDFGNPFVDAAKVKTQKAKSSWLKAQSVITIQEAESFLKQQFAHVLLTQKQLETATQTAQQFANISSKSQQRFQLGEITEVNALLLTRQQNELELLVLELEQLYRQELLLFNQLLNQREIVFVPLETEALDKMLTNNLPVISAQQAPQVMAEIQQQNVIANQLAAEKRSWVPSLSAGYFSQEIDGIAPFNGFSVGVSVPLWFLPQKAAIKTQKVNLEQQAMQRESAENTIHSEITILTQRHKMLEEKRNYFEQTALKQALLLRQQTATMVNAGEVSTLEIIQAIKAVNQIEIDYYEVLKQLATTRFQLEQYASSTF